MTAGRFSPGDPAPKAIDYPIFGQSTGRWAGGDFWQYNPLNGGAIVFPSWVKIVYQELIEQGQRYKDCEWLVCCEPIMCWHDKCCGFPPARA